MNLADEKMTLKEAVLRFDVFRDYVGRHDDLILHLVDGSEHFVDVGFNASGVPVSFCID